MGHLGDTVIALPSLWAIRKTFPNAHITLLSNRYSVAGRISPDHVVPARGLIDDYLDYPSNDSWGDAFGMLRLWLSLRTHCFDTLIYLAPRLRRPRHIQRDLLFFQLAGIRNVIGHKGFEPLPTRRNGEPLPFVEHEVDHLLRRLSLSEIPVPAPEEVNVDLALTEAEHDAARKWMHTHLPEQFSFSRFVGFAPGSKWPSKVWPEDRFVELGRRLIEERDIYPIVFGGPEDRPLAQRLITLWGRGANAAGEFPVRQAAAALATCKLYVGNDTGTMHLAAAVGTRCVVTMSALDWPGRWNPYGSGHTVFRRQVPCGGCLLEVCTTEGLRCLKEISVAEVVEACLETLGPEVNKPHIITDNAEIEKAVFGNPLPN